MTVEEIQREFLFKYDAASSGGPSLNTYEQSICLTQAAKDVYDAAYKSYEQSEISKRILAPFLSSYQDVPIEIEDDFTNLKTYKIKLNDNLNYRLKESVKLQNCIETPKVISTDKDVLSESLNNPFKRPNKRKVLREDISQLEVKLYSLLPILIYKVDYLKSDTPIIVVDLSQDPELEGDETIMGLSNQSNTKIPSLFLDKVIDRAVILAIKISRENNLQSNINI